MAKYTTTMMRLLPSFLIALIAISIIGSPCVVVVSANNNNANDDEKDDEEKVTFTLYDNGSSVNGVNVTLTASGFSQLLAEAAAKEAADAASASPPPPAEEAFAVAMSTTIDGIQVSKYKAPEPVIATRAFREDGELITTFEQLRPAVNANKNQYRRVYLVAEDLEFVWPFVEMGHRQVISTKVVPPAEADGRPLILESVSEAPRVFRVYNMASEQEANAIIEVALNATGTNALKRSTVGSGTDEDGNEVAHEDYGRTSDNAWDHKSPVAKAMITRSFQLTNIKENAGKRDGLQVVRYRPTQGYNTHPDYFTAKDDGTTGDFDFYPYSGGSNRFATVFMYLNDPEEGGATVFPRVPRVGPELDLPAAAQDLFQPGTWEHTVNNDCYTKLAVPAKLGTAALFYSITPDGRIDPLSHHAACPLIKGTKWGANIWIWNKQRFGEIRTGDPRSVEMKNEADDTVYISWEGKDSGSILPGQTMAMNSFEYHRFKASFHSHKEKAFAEFTVQSEPEHQVWEIKRPRRQQRTAATLVEKEVDTPPVDRAIKVTARNTMGATVYITWKDEHMRSIEPGESTNLNTFQGHAFKASLGSWSGKVFQTYYVKDTPVSQAWNIQYDQHDEL